MKRLALLALAPLLPLSLAITPTQAAVPTCNGMDATIVGTDLDDDLDGTDGNDVVYLGPGSDKFDGLGGNDVICGGSGDDRITPGTGDDTVFAESGNDKVYEGPGTDYLDGGDGPSDSLLYSRWSGDAALRLDARIGQATTADGTDSFKNFAHYVGTTGSDTLIGSSKPQLIDGYGGADTIYGFGGNDRLFVAGFGSFVDAGDGNDGVQAGSARQLRVRLGNGDDYLFFSHVGSGNWFSGGAGTDALIARGKSMELNLNQGFALEYSSGARMAIPGFENAEGGFGSDKLVGNAASNVLRGSTGNDRLYGLGADDVLDGQQGANSADGGPGSDACRAQVQVNCER